MGIFNRFQSTTTKYVEALLAAYDGASTVSLIESLRSWTKRDPDFKKSKAFSPGMVYVFVHLYLEAKKQRKVGHLSLNDLKALFYAMILAKDRIRAEQRGTYYGTVRDSLGAIANDFHINATNFPQVYEELKTDFSDMIFRGNTGSVVIPADLKNKFKDRL